MGTNKSMTYVVRTKIKSNGYRSVYREHEFGTKAEAQAYREKLNKDSELFKREFREVR